MPFREIHLWPVSAPTVGVTLSPTFGMDGGEWQFRNKVEELAFAHGGRQVGDGKIASRTVKLKGWFWDNALTVAGYQAVMDKVAVLSNYSDLRLKITDTDGADSRYVDIERIALLREKWSDGTEGRVAEIDLEFKAADPFWHLAAGTTVSAAAGLTVSFTGASNSGNVDAWPTVRVESDIGAVPGFSFENQSIAGQTYSISMAIGGAGYIEIDEEDGSIDGNGANWSKYFSGRFVRMVPGANNLRLIFASAPPAGTTVTVGWQNRSMVGP